MARRLRALDRGISVEAVHAVIEGRRPDDVRRALAATRRERPADPLSYFTACLGKRIAGEIVLPRRGIPAVKRGEDGYGA